MEYGLIGESLSHSFSKYLHEKYLNTNYELVSLSKEELKDFFKRKDFKGINVTIPYKKEVIQYLDEVDYYVKRCGSCNTIINEKGKLKGYNTDYYGFKFLLLERNVVINYKNVAILGSGGTFDTIKEVIKDLKAKNIYCISRTKKENTYTYEELYNLEVDVLINTTPVGMYPNNNEVIVDINKFNKLEAVIDVIFNPLRSNLVLEGMKKKIPSYGGLDMLIAQGVKASELFLNKKYTLEQIRSNFFDILVDKFNIVLIGMPMSGKTTIGKMLANAFNKDFIDIDKEIVTRENRSINEIFEVRGEAYFRELEAKLCEEYSKKNNLIISCGGGVIKNLESIRKLKQNGMIVFIDRKIEKMIFNQKRPLSRTKEEVEQLFLERYDLYLNNSDARVTNNGSKKKTVIHIVEAFYEYINR